MKASLFENVNTLDINSKIKERAVEFLTELNSCLDVSKSLDITRNICWSNDHIQINISNENKYLEVYIYLNYIETVRIETDITDLDHVKNHLSWVL